MHSKNRSFLIIFAILAISLLVASPILSFDKPPKPTPPPAQNGQGNGNNGDNGNHGNGNNGNNGNHGNGNNGQATEPADVSTNNGSISTPAPVLGCQKNNPDRLDCSSLDVGGHCDGTAAVFTIHNSGEPGNGDMRAPTEYRIIVDGVVVQSGTVQLTGGETLEIRYEGGGTATLEADQQVGHPGKSHPRTTLTCGEPEYTPTPTEVPTEEPTPEVTPTAEAPALSGEVICWPDGSTAFLISNNGGDMPEPEVFTVTDAGNNVVDQGTLQLYGGESTTLVYSVNYGPLSLTMGDLVILPSILPQCGEPTPEVTPPPDAPNLTADAQCYLDGTMAFIITNNGSDMLSPSGYTVTDANGNIVEQNSIQLASGQSTTLVYPTQYGSLTLIVDGGLAYAVLDCLTPTPEVTPPPDVPSLTADAQCWLDGSIAFIITNYGGDMLSPSSYVVVNGLGNVIDQGDIQLLSGETTSLVYPNTFGTLTLMVGGGLAFTTIECPQVTPEITPEPTVEVTPEPTQEVTPEPTVDITPTPAPVYGCQKNNPDRLDCSSLQVSAQCDGSVAIFTIRNTGKWGEGNMVAPTEYRIIVDGTVVESGTVQLEGGNTTQILYSGGGSVTLIADQQVGHPGKSEPQATISCGG